MKKEYNFLVVIGLVFGSLGMAMVFQAASAKNVQSEHSQNIRPIPTSNMQIVKKTFLPPVFGETKGKPDSPLGKDKIKDEGAATGELGTEATGDKYAIIIGICDYPGADHDLCNSDGDSLNTYKALTTLYGYDPANIRLFKDMGNITYFEEDLNDAIPSITSEVPTHNNIYDAIIDIKDNPNLTPDDEVVFFFSGHGGWLRDDDSNPIDLYPYDEAEGDQRDELILVHDDAGTGVAGMLDDDLVSWFSGFNTTRIVFIFDTCLAGGMNDLADTGRIVVMATDETHSAYVYSTGTYDIDGDGVKDGEGVFTHFFVNKGMLQGLADVYDHGIDDGNAQTLGEDVVVEEAFDYGKSNIPGRLKRLQKPVISDGFNDDLLL